ncbi:MAG TPA: CHAD domain-containing protein, partial [Parafilimonas sp.]
MLNFILMKEKEIIEIIQDRFKIIDKLYRKIIDEFDADDIHDFRVAVKKLRAFLRFLDVKKADEPVI